METCPPSLEHILRAAREHFPVLEEALTFRQVTQGRYFSERKHCDNIAEFYVVLEPNVKGPVHNHAGQNIEETHVLLYGSGKFIIYRDGLPVRELPLEQGVPHEIFSTPKEAPDHQFVAGPEGAVLMAFEKHY
jgi:hypothetical protein